jgi:hypothetical protein
MEDSNKQGQRRTEISAYASMDIMQGCKYILEMKKLNQGLSA